ncbi:hypothetical protein JR316_0004643 [Psilocybe cubensis]|uniref:Uncharacterized protein n=2 Tax=Psilocybe cubensis TaxID=181762 RepID=A0ACB8H3R7_PSICU|nr:hypothetical protein JR316_0004643 [Psilocybe cubensis]KAH9482543.1 hypothetical protein JR316_0004643 [Psilocybe cubensis]
MPKVEKKTDNRQWICSECPKSFGRKGDLTRHELLHLGVKPHVCTTPGCGKAFSQYSGLKTHQNVHTKAKPYVCQLDSCNASFGDPSSCARHRKETHRRVSGYFCPVPRCNSRIKRRSAFTSHIKRHGIDPATLDIDSYAPPLLPVAVPVPRSGRSSRDQTIVPHVDTKANVKVPERPKFNEAERDLYHSLRTNTTTNLDDVGLYGSPYSRQFEAYHGPYPSSLHPSVTSTYSHLTSPNSAFEYNVDTGRRLEDLYIVDSTMRRSASNVNIHRTPPSSPSRHIFTSALTPETSSGRDLQTVNITHGSLTFDHFSFPASSSVFEPAHKPYGNVTHDGKLTDMSPYYNIPSSETSWTFV